MKNSSLRRVKENVDYMDHNMEYVNLKKNYELYSDEYENAVKRVQLQPEIQTIVHTVAKFAG